MNSKAVDLICYSSSDSDSYSDSDLSEMSSNNTKKTTKGVRAPVMPPTRKAVAVPMRKDVAVPTRKTSIVDLTEDTPKKSNLDISMLDDIQAALDRFSCPICFDIWPSDVTATKCGHVFCTKCIEKFLTLRKQCPTCNKDVKSIDLFKLFI